MVTRSIAVTVTVFLSATLVSVADSPTPAAPHLYPTKPSSGATRPAKPLPGVGRTFGYVPDAATAVRIAITVFEPIYGKKQIASEGPFRATLLKDGVWLVFGAPLPAGWVGGTAQALIRRKDGKVLAIQHGA